MGKILGNNKKVLDRFFWIVYTIQYQEELLTGGEAKCQARKPPHGGTLKTPCKSK